MIELHLNQSLEMSSYMNFAIEYKVLLGSSGSQEGFYIFHNKSLSEGLYLGGLKRGRIVFLSPRNRKTDMI